MANRHYLTSWWEETCPEGGGGGGGGKPILGLPPPDVNYFFLPFLAARSTMY